MIVAALPLADKDSNKERRQYKVQSFGIKGNAASKQAAQGCAGHPVQLVKGGNKEHEPALVDAGRDSCRAVDGKGFVAHAEDKVGLLPAHPLEALQHGDAVEQMTGVNHQRHAESANGVKGGEQQPHGNKFYGAGKD